MATPAASAIGKDWKPATSAAAVAASTRFVITVGWSVAIGAIRIAARPASPQPSPQLIAAIVSGDQPSDAAARWFSATAVVPRPKRVYRYSHQSAAAEPAAIASRMTRSAEMKTPLSLDPQRCQTLVGRSLRT